MRRPSEPRRRRLQGLAILLGVAALVAISVAARAQILPIFNLTTDDGLAAVQVWDVLQDRRGYLWIATSEGINRYDGSELQAITGAEGLRNQVVRRLAEAPDGALWLATSEGLARYDGRGLSFHGTREGVPAGIVWDLSFDRRGDLWFATSQAGLGLLHAGKVRFFSKRDGLAADDAYSLHVGRDDTLWVGSRGAGVARCRIAGGGITGCAVFTRAQGIAGDSVRSIVEDGAGRIWLGSRDGGVTRWDGSRFTTFTTRDGLADDDVYRLLVRRDGELVVGSANRGITICSLPDLHACRSIDKRNGLNVDPVLGLGEDSEGNLWIGLNNGLAKLISEKLESFDERFGLPGPGGYAVLPEANGDVWVGTYGGLGKLRLGPRYAPPRVQTWTAPDALPSSETWDVLRDHRGRLWVATALGLCRFDEERGRCAQVFTHAQGLAGDYVLDLYETREGDLWLGMLNGVSRLHWPAGAPADAAPQVLTLTERDGLPAAQVQAITQDHRGTVWIACNGGGLVAWREGAVRAWTAADGLPSQTLYGLYADDEGSLWVGTGGSGAVRFHAPSRLDRPLHFDVFGPEQGIAARAVYAIRGAGGSRLWLGTTGGVYLFDPAAHDGRGEVLRHFDKTSGLIARDVPTANSLALDGRGHLWMGFAGGFARYDPALEEQPLPPPPVRLERVTIAAGGAEGTSTVLRVPFSSPPRLREHEAWLDPAARLVVPPGRNNLRFDFRALTFRAPKSVRYEVQLIGFDPGWSPTGSDTFKEYTNLDPGTYRFGVRAAVGDAYGPVTTIGVRLRPAFWQTAWFATAAALLTLLLLVAAHRVRTRRIQLRARQLESVVDERTDDLRRYARALEEHSHALDRANARIRQTSRFKSQFLANMSHELRTPLNAIIGFSQVLERRLAGRADARELGFLDNVLESGKHLLHLIDNLLDLSKIEAGKMDVHVEEAELGAVVDGVRTIMEGYCRERDVTLVQRLPTHLVPIAVDVPKLKQILFNLLSNAIKFSPHGGVVELDARIVPATDSPLAVDSYLVSVIDHGVGIPVEDQARIFEEFRQVHHGGDRPAGTGLGLAIVYRFVRLLGGEIDLESDRGKGSSFRVLLPREASERAGLLESDEEAAGDPLAARPRVLVVEPDRETFALLADALEAHGILPVRARHPEDAVRVAREVHPVVIAVDVGSATLGGWETVAALHADPQSADRALVLLSLADRRRGGTALGFDAWLERPVDGETFVAALRRLAPPGLGEAAVPVLVVEDDAPSRESLELALAGAGLPVLTAADRRRAVELARAHRPQVIAVALTMPALEGFALTRALQRDARTARIPVVALASPAPKPAERDAISDMLAAGGAGAPAAELVATVEAILRRHQGSAVTPWTGPPAPESEASAG